MLFLLTWSVVIVVGLILKKYVNDINGHYLSLLHAITLCLLSSFNININNFDSCFAIENEKIDMFYVSLHILLCYISFDLVMTKQNNEMKLHHVIVILCCLLAFYVDQYQTISACMFLNEGSTIFLNLTKIYSKCTIYKILFVFTFLIFRIYLLTFLCIELFLCYSFNISSTIAIMLFSIHTLLNYYWWFKICKKICKQKYNIKKLQEKKTKS